MSEKSTNVPTMDEFNALKAQVDAQGQQIAALDGRVTALEAGGATPEPQPPEPEPPEPAGDFTFREEFDTLSLWNRDAPDDSAIWRPTRWYSADEWDGWNCNAGRMTNPYNQGGTAYLYGVDGESNLFLAIDRAVPQNHGNCDGRPFISSQINQLSFKQKGGYWEGRLKCPDIAGTNFAFWLMNDVSWPPEVDIVEMVNFTDGGHVMAQNLWNTDQTTNPYYNYDCALTDWHTYGFWWDDANGRMHYFFDGQHTQEVPKPSGYDHPMFAILSAQQGGDWSGPIPDNAAMGRMLVDYVRISNAPPGALLSAPQAAPSGIVPARGASRGLGSLVRRFANPG